MPPQETFLELQKGLTKIKVIKTYDASFAHEVFQGVDATSLRRLADSLDLTSNYALQDIPPPDSPDYGDFLWEELCDGAREDGQVKSFFVVTIEDRVIGKATPFVAGDWPTAEAFARTFGPPQPVYGSSIKS